MTDVSHVDAPQPSATVLRVLQVLVVSSTPVLAAGIQRVIQDQFGEAAAAVPTLPITSAPRKSPAADVVIYDAATPGRLDIDGLRGWVGVGTPVVLLTRDAQTQASLAARHPRAGGLVLGATAADVADALMAAAAGRPRRAGSGTAVPMGPGLSDREVEILARIASGWSNQEIADRLYLSINTVKTYIRTAYRKLGISRRAQAVLWCLDHDVPLVETTQ